MRIRAWRPLAAACVCVLLTATAQAAGARFWQVSTQSEFLKGDADNLAIDQFGRVTLGRGLTPLGGSPSPFIWSALPAPDGSVFAGTGNDGRVYRFKPDGTQSVFFDAPELEVHALALAPGGGLYVGTSPDGKVYKVDASGSSSVYFDPDDKYIWALVTDPSGTLYAATGEKGVIYRITAAGKGEPFYRTKATHALTLLLDRDGNLLAGTQAPAKVFRIRKDGTGFVLLDTPLDEISALRLDDKGTLYAAAFSGQPSSQPSGGGPADRTADDQDRSAPLPSVSTEITAVTIVDMSAATSGSVPPREERRSVRGAVYRIPADGAWDTLWESSDDSPYDLLPEADGSLLVATGNKGKLYRLTGDPVRVTLVARADAQQITALLRERNDIWVATSNPGKLLTLSDGQASKGTFQSDVRDAETVATWGAISWRGTVPQGSSARLFTRSGNTKVPDETWSPWSGAYTRQEGDQITSPKARYLQWKLELAGSGTASPMVTSVSIAYLQRNLRPELTSITVHPSGVVFQKPFSTGEAEIAGFDAPPTDRRTAPTASVSAYASSTPPLGRRSYQKGLQTITWRADDDNDDDLQYDVLYRREGETSWKPLKRNLSDEIFVWDTTSVPNGTYVVKIVASDASANPPGTALTGERESRAFDVDNSPPEITVTGVRRTGARTVVEFTVTDDFSAVQRVEYALDADRWRPIYPKDGIADSPSEQFELAIDGDTTDKAIILRATDAMNNVASARAEMTKKQDRK